MRTTLILALLCVSCVASAQNEATDTDSLAHADSPLLRDSLDQATYLQRPDSMLDTLFVTAKPVDKPKITMDLNIDKTQMALMSAGQKMPEGLNLLGGLYYLFKYAKINFKTKGQRRRERAKRQLNEAYPDD